MGRLGHLEWWHGQLGVRVRLVWRRCAEQHNGSTVFDVTIDGQTTSNSFVTLNSILPNYIINSLNVSRGDTLLMQPDSDLAVNTIANAGTILVGGLLRVSGATALNGGGTINLSGSGVLTVPNGARWSNVDNTILGSGIINNLSLNQGVISGNVASHSIYLSAAGTTPDSGTLTNSGTLSAVNGGSLSVSVTNLINPGQIIANGGTLNLTVSGSTSSGSTGQIALQAGQLYFYRDFAIDRDDEIVANNGKLSFVQKLTTTGHTLTAAKNVATSIATLNNNNGTINLAGSLSLGNTSNVGGTILLNTATNSVSASNAVIDNTAGTFSLNGGAIFTLQNSAKLNGGTLTGSGDSALLVTGSTNSTGGTISNLTNRGTINLANNSTVAGTINGSGTINLQGAAQLSGSTVSFGNQYVNLLNGGADAPAGSTGSLNLSFGYASTVSGYASLCGGSGASNRTIDFGGQLESTRGPDYNQATLAIGAEHVACDFAVNVRFGSTLAIRSPDVAINAFVGVDSGGTLLISSTNAGTADIGYVGNSGTVILEQGSATIGYFGGGTLSCNDSGSVTIGQIMSTNLYSTGTIVLRDNGGSTVSKVKAFSVPQIDLNNQTLLVDYAAGNSPFTSLQTKIRTGFANHWQPTANSIFSSNASAAANREIGIAELASLFAVVPSSYLNTPVDSSTVVMRYTYAGDANLDGKVDVVDLGMLAAHWQQNGSWVNGDFNYDGVVDIVDLGVLASDWQAGATGSGMSFAEALASVNFGDASVPEPAVLAPAALLLLRRRRRMSRG